MSIKNYEMANYHFLQGMYKDGYYPVFLVDKAKEILIRLCESIELNKPQSVDALYTLTRVATEEFNVLEEEFEDWHWDTHLFDKAVTRHFDFDACPSI